MGVFILSQVSILILLALSVCQSLPDKEGDVQPGYVVLHPPRNLTMMYIGDGDVYFYWDPPQNYHTHKPENLTNDQIENIHNKDGVYFSDDGTYVDKGSDNYRKSDWMFKLLSFSGLSPDVPSTDHTDQQKSQDSTLQPNQTLDYHISLANLTAHQVKQYTEHLKNKNISALPDWFKQNVVPKEHSAILWYTIFWQEMENGTNVGKLQNDTVSPERLDYHIKGLKAQTEYNISVQVTYSSFTALKSEHVSVQTNKNYSLIYLEDHKEVTDFCRCDAMGTINGTARCKPHKYGVLSLSLCDCKEGYAGMYCHTCMPGYYRLRIGLPCIRCPCDPLRTAGSICYFEEAYLFCDTCREGYSGNLCQACASGYYRPRASNRCTKCNCHGNSKLCQDITGECIACRHNTAGFNCNRCEHGYVGNAKAKVSGHEKCVLAARQEKSGVSSGTIAGVCVAIIVCVGIITGVIIYKRCWNYPSARPFWTVELKDDHEGINFSSVPEDELVAISAREEEGNFYQSQGGKRSKSGSQPYSHLREAI